MKNIILIASYFVTMSFYAQIGLGTTTPHVSSAIDLSSTSKGLLIPRMTFGQRNVIVSPANGLMVWCTDCATSGEMQVYNGTAWTTTLGAEASPPAPTNLLYTGSPFVYVINEPITPVQPTNTGGTVVSYAISPGLPAGLSLNTSTGAISGTPTAVTASANYTITATNSGGSSTADISIAVNDIVPAFTYSGAPFVYAINAPITSVQPTNTGGTVVSYAISPGLPAGLSLNTSTGAISGTPTAITTSSNYTITATNSGGSSTYIISITVTYPLDILSSPSAAAFSLRKLRTAYTGPLVRITIGTSYYDVYPDNSVSNTFSLSSPISAAYTTFNAASTGINGSNTLNSIISGSTNATVVTWYDQSGNTRDLIQSNTANQPQIISNGSIITRSGKPVVYLPALPAVSYLQNTSALIGLPASIINVAGIDNLTTSNLGMSHIGSGDGIGFRIGVGGNLIASKRNVANLTSNSFVTANSLNVLTLTQEASGVNSNLTRLFLNGSQSTITSGETLNILNPSARYIIGVFDNNGSLQTFQNEGFISENIVFSQIISTTERQALESNQGAYYSITVN